MVVCNLHKEAKNCLLPHVSKVGPACSGWLGPLSAQITVGVFNTTCEDISVRKIISHSHQRGREKLMNAKMKIQN